MAISREEAGELASMLPPDMSCNNARERLLCLVEVLRCLTDAEHALSNADIRAVLRAYFGDGCAPAENTIGADLRAICASGCLGMAVHVTPSGAWCERTGLSLAKVRLLMNAVQSSQFFTMAQRNDLLEDLCDLVSRHEEGDLMAQVLVDQRVRRDSLHVFDTIDTVARAMRLRRRIEFTYTYSDFGGKAQPLAGDDGQTLRCETPVAMYFSGGNYYVETYSSTPWRHGICLVRSRADRMVGTRVSAQAAERNREAYDAARSARRRMEREFDMVDGPRRLLFLRVRADATNVVYDRFGFGLRFAQFEGTLGEPDATGLTLVEVAQAFTFYRWLSTAGEGVVMAQPPVELALRTGPWKRALRDVSRERLLGDYHEAVDGFLAFLDRARAPYA